MMTALMLRLDVFERTHDSLFRFWKNIMQSFDNSNVLFITEAFTSWSESYSPRIFPEMYILSESYFNLQCALNDLEDAEKEIKTKLDMSKLLDILKASIEVARGTSDMNMEKRNLLEEYHEIEESKSLLIRDMEKLSKVILKERQKIWIRIDNLIIDSYKRLLYDITGSDEFAEAFMNNMRRYEPTKYIGLYRRNRNYEMLIETAGVIDECIESWILDVEIMVGVEE